MLKKILIGLALLFAIAQLVQPDRSTPRPDRSGDMLTITNAPPGIRALFIGACYDCHSYSTEYPWYSYITPVNFWQQHHINEGREVLNFSEWRRYAGTEAANETGESIAEGEMPPGYYSFIHDHGRLTAGQTAELIAWVNTSISAGEGEGTSEPEEDHGENED